jgi:hypothetical protein
MYIAKLTMHRIPQDYLTLGPRTTCKSMRVISWLECLQCFQPKFGLGYEVNYSAQAVCDDNGCTAGRAYVGCPLQQLIHYIYT